MQALLLRINSKDPESTRIRIAASAIRRGGIVVFPTETVYGIGANALDRKACEGIFRAKGRERDNPLIVHVEGMAMAERIALVPEKYRKFIEKTWPGPVTFVMRARSALPKVVTAGRKTVAVRMPANRIALALIRESGVPIAAPSANKSKMPSSTSAAHSMRYFGETADVIIDGGKARIGLESTVVDLRSFSLLRPGAMTAERIERVFGRKLNMLHEKKVRSGRAPPSPGMKYKHYAPEKPLFLFEGRAAALAPILKKTGRKAAFIGSSESCMKLHGIAVCISLGSARSQAAVARNLFDALIKVDSVGAEFAVIESFGERGIGLAIMNRIRKASDNKSFRSMKELEALLSQAGY